MSTSEMVLFTLLLFSNIYFIGGDGTSSAVNVYPTSAGNYSVVRNTSGRGGVCELQPNRIQWAFFACLVIFIPVTIAGNGLVCFVIGVTPSLRRQPMYMFLASLAIADILVGIISMPIKAKMQWDGGCFHFPWFMCWLFTMFEITFSVASTTNLFIIAIDRYLALKCTFKYKNVMKRSVCLYVLLSVWVYALLWSVLGIFTWDKHHKVSIIRGRNGCIMINFNYFTTLYILGYIAPVFLMAFIYSFVYNTALRHLNEISRLEVRDNSISKERERRKKQMKLLSSMVIVFMTYVVCWIPCVLFILVGYYEKKIALHFHKEWFQVLHFTFINFLPHINSSLNPFIYVISNSTFRSTMYKVIVQKRRNSNEYPAQSGYTTGTYVRDSSFALQTLKQDYSYATECTIRGIVNKAAETNLD